MDIYLQITTIESGSVKALEIFREGDVSEALTFSESRDTKSSQSIRQGDLAETCTLIECSVLDYGNEIWQFYTCSPYRGTYPLTVVWS